jgi:hypothetical protein
VLSPFADKGETVAAKSGTENGADRRRVAPFLTQTSTADLAAHPQIGQIASDERPVKRREVSASRKKHRLSRFAEQQLHGVTSSKESHRGSGMDHAEQNRIALQSEPGAFASAAPSRDK